MAQFDVHKNPGANREAVPFVVIVQSAAYDSTPRRVVIPLARTTVYGAPSYARLTPQFVVDGVSVVLRPFELVSVPADKLGKRVGTLREHGPRIISAIDELITGAFD